MKYVSVYSRNASLFILPASRTDAGIWIETDPVTKLPEDGSPKEKGDAVLAAFDGSKQGLTSPVDPNAPTSSLLKVAGVKSWSAFENSARVLSVKLDANELRLSPWRTCKDHGFAPIKNDDTILEASASAERIGLALEDAMKRCRF